MQENQDKTNLKEYRQYLFSQKEILESTAVQLKKEFVGIDIVIDQIIDAVASWFFFPEMQERPVIINLWGLTGIGKTSLIKRFSQLIGFEERYYRFDLGESTSTSFDIQDSFQEIHENYQSNPFIIALDEFQFARTLNEKEEEIDKSSSRVIWDLLDSGKFDLVCFKYSISNLSQLIKKLNIALHKGVEVVQGYVVENVEIYKNIFPDDNDSEEQNNISNVLFVPSDMYYYITSSLSNNYFLYDGELKDKLLKLNGEETINYLLSLYKRALKPRTVDCSKGLIFIMGNLDEVYSMTHNFNPDMDADEFNKQSLKISITQVKNALLTRFRSEQIARLGNNHIIYPSFTSDSFYKIIDLELTKIAKKINKLYGFNLMFDHSIKELIYQEGVYPTQGTRPLFTTVNQIINTRLGRILNEVYIGGYDVDSLYFFVDDAQSTSDEVTMRVDFKKEDKLVFSWSDKQSLVLGKLRKEKRNDEQAIVAVHESGHAILSALLMHTIPTSIFSVTADNNSQGFVLARTEWNYVSKKELINRLAVLLGGLIAERIVFGDENITIGANSDLASATKLITYALYACGMGDTLGLIGNENMDETPAVLLENNKSEVNLEVKKYLKEAEDLAKVTLEKQKRLLLHLADYLSDKRVVDSELMMDFLLKYAVDFNKEEIVTDADFLFYREHLKNQLKGL